MDAHPDIAAPPPLHIMRNVIDQFDTIIAKEKEISQVRTVTLQRLSHALKRHYRPDVMDFILERVSGLESFTAQQVTIAIYTSIFETTGKRHFFVKENNLQHHAMFLMGCFQNVRFVYQVRESS